MRHETSAQTGQPPWPARTLVQVTVSCASRQAAAPAATAETASASGKLLSGGNDTCTKRHGTGSTGSSRVTSSLTGTGNDTTTTAGTADISYRIVEIFETLQGEGFNTGMPAIFIRFGKCNLACPWCDTDYNTFGSMRLADILARVKSFSARNIVITGGEPTIQPHLEHLLDALKAEGYFLAIETNGLKPVPEQFDYIATSPKRLYAKAYEKRHISFAHEVRIVADGDVREFCAWIEDRILAERYYLSPCERDGQMNMLDTITQLGQLNQRPGRPNWQLSIQTHKLAGIE